MRFAVPVDGPAHPGDPLAPPMPEHLQLEITSACNLRCTMCLVRYRPPVNRLAGAMSLDLFRRRLLDAADPPEVCRGCALYQSMF